jgi:ribonuclease HI
LGWEKKGFDGKISDYGNVLVVYRKHKVDFKWIKVITTM